jgi:hypothetical protein
MEELMLQSQFLFYFRIAGEAVVFIATQLPRGFSFRLGVIGQAFLRHQARGLLSNQSAQIF